MKINTLPYGQSVLSIRYVETGLIANLHISPLLTADASGFNQLPLFQTKSQITPHLNSRPPRNGLHLHDPHAQSILHPPKFQIKMVIKPKHRKPSWPSSKKSSITCLENQNAHISSSARKNLVCFAGLRRIKSGSPKYKSPLPKMSNLKKVFRFS